jgi:hypothetical protein
MGKVGPGTILSLVVLIGLLVLAIAFMLFGWDMPEGGTPMSTIGWIAMVVGVLVTLALGAGLMALMFYSSRRGRD